MSDDLKERLRNAADRFLKWAHKVDYSGPPVLSIPAHRGNIDRILNEAADRIAALEAQLAEARADGMREAAEIAEKERDTFAAETRQEKISGTPNSVLVAAGRQFGAGYVATSITAAIEKDKT